MGLKGVKMELRNKILILMGMFEWFQAKILETHCIETIVVGG